jgi:putative transposase
VSRYRFIAAEKVNYPVRIMCRVLEVSPSGFYAWSVRRPSSRSEADTGLSERIGHLHRASRGTYGAPRIQAALASEGVGVSRKRVARLMRQQGLCGIHRPRRRAGTTVVDKTAPVAPNLVERHFTPGSVNCLWAADITYVRTGEGWLYLASILDCHSRRVVGWSMADHLRTELAVDALRMALGRRRPARGQLVHHSDRGCQYTAAAYQAILAAHGVRASMSRAGEPLDNAIAESFFSTLKVEVVNGRRWDTRAQAAQAIFEWIEVFYNRQRLHSSLGYRTPAQFEEIGRAEEIASD